MVWMPMLSLGSSGRAIQFLLYGRRLATAWAQPYLRQPRNESTPTDPPTGGGDGHARAEDCGEPEPVEALAGAAAPSRLCGEGPRGQPPLSRGSARDSASGDLVREVDQQRDRAGDRVLPHLLRPRRRQRARVFPVRRPGDVREDAGEAAGRGRPLRPYRAEGGSRRL